MRRAVLPGALALAAIGVAALPALAAAEPGFGRHLELATPPNKLGQPTRFTAMSTDGKTVQFGTSGGNGLPDTGSHQAFSNSYFGRRDDHRWEYFPMNLPEALYGKSYVIDVTATLDAQVLRGQVDPATSAFAYVLRRPGKAPEQLSPVIASRAGVSKLAPPNFAGASADLRHLVFTANPSAASDPENAYLPTDPPPGPSGSPRKLYETVAGSPPILRRVDVDDTGAPIGMCDGESRQATLGSRIDANINVERAVSADGQRIFFSAAPDCVSRRVYARTGGATTTEVSASECDRVEDPQADPPVPACEARAGDDQYESASSDGRRVFFTTGN